MNLINCIAFLAFALAAVPAEAQIWRVQPGNPGQDIMNRPLQANGRYWHSLLVKCSNSLKAGNAVIGEWHCQPFPVRARSVLGCRAT